MIEFPTADFLDKVADAESGILSCLKINLLEAGAAVTRAQITADYFSAPRVHLFEPIMGMWADGKPFDMLTLVDRLRSSDTLSHWPNTFDVHNAFQFTSIGMLPEYLRMLAECRASRKLHSMALSVLSEIYDPATALVGARRVLDGISIDPQIKSTSLKDHLKTAIAQMMGTAEGEGIEFGLGLDQVCGPFSRGDLVVLAGETKKGKSALAGNIVENVADAGGRCVVFGLEMTGAQTAERMLASQSRIDIRSLKMRLRGNVSPTQNQNEQDALIRTMGRMKDWKVDLVEDVGSIAQIVAAMIRFSISGGVDLVVVDYAQLCEGIRHKGDSREREVASVSGALKKAAGHCGCVVLLLSQLNEEGRLRESRALGQDANCVMAIEGDGQDMQVRVVAARSAPTGTEHKLQWRPSFTRFFQDEKL